MRLTTIWTLPSMTLAERLRRSVDAAAMELASRLPLRIRYWATMQEIARATRNSPNVPATPLDQILKALDTPKNLS
jgi:hypothetical protein